MVRSWASHVAQMVKNPPANAEDPSSIPGSGRSPGRGHGNPLQYSCLENPMDRAAWQAYIPWGYKESNTTERLSLFFHILGFELMLLFFLIVLFIICFFFMCWVFFSVCRLSLVAGRKGYSLVAVHGLLTGGFSLLWSTGSRHMDPVAVAHRPSRSTACGILLRTWTRTCVP